MENLIVNQPKYERNFDPSLLFSSDAKTRLRNNKTIIKEFACEQKMKELEIPHDNIINYMKRQEQERNLMKEEIKNLERETKKKK